MAVNGVAKLVRVIGKGVKERLVPLPEAFGPVFVAWINGRKKRGGGSSSPRSRVDIPALPGPVNLSTTQLDTQVSTSGWLTSYPRLGEIMRHPEKRAAALLILFVSSVDAYDRSDYPHWIDDDGDGQDTRQEILIRDSQVAVTFRPDGKVVSGLWVCPYTGRIIRNPSDIDVDHLVALGEIDAAGASVWALEQRAQFANDPDNLVAVAKGSNRSKKDKDAYLWLPPNIANGSWYLNARDTVWRKYGVEIDNDERKAVEFFENKCPKHEKGIKLNRVRRWLGTWFDGLF